jgi:CubicO group peptidase (beta-lactamase class C family)
MNNKGNFPTPGVEELCMRTGLTARAAVAVLLVLFIVAGVQPAPVQPDLQPQGEKALAAVLKPFVESKSLAGAVILVADKEKVLDLEAVGYSDIGADTLMGTDAIFWIASQSKPITAAILMMLVDDGLLKLDDPVKNYLPEFGDIWVATEKDKDHVLLKRPDHPITIREILSHTSGLPFASALEQPTLDALSLRVGVRSYAMTPLVFQPGTKYQYSNAGINTAGRIIEVVSKMSYEDFLQKRLCGPLGMKDTTFWPNDAQLKRLAKAYRPNKAKNGLEETKISQLQYPLNDAKRQPMPAGGLFSTASDVGRFCQMVLNGGSFQGKRYLSEAAVKEMTSRQTGKGIKESYGLGWSTSGDVFGHGGAYATNMTIDSNRGLITVFMVQHAGFPGKGGECHGAFRKAALERFGKKTK